MRHIVKTTIGVSDVKSVFVNTGLEYPEIQKFVRKIKDEENDVEIIKPNMSFVEVLEKYGYPVVSKEISQVIEYARLSKTIRKKTYIDAMSKMNNEFLDKNGNLSKYNYPKWRFLIDAPFKISSKCCDVLKKGPIKKFERKTKLKPIVGTLACESLLRRQHWYKHGCNGFNMTNPKSSPLSFWQENDILEYLKTYNIPYCSVYGEIKKHENGNYYTTKLSRTGCMFCMFGCHREKEPNRFQKMKITHPNQYKYCMEKLGIKKVLEFLNIMYD